MIFTKEPLTDALWSEAMPLLLNHWSEVAHFKDIPLEPDVAMYRKAEEAGAVRCFTARWAGALVGYCLFTVRPNPHYASSIQAFQDVLYIAPAARGVSAFKFMLWCDEQLKAEGIQAVYQHLKIEHDHPELMARLGYTPVDRIYAKRLD